MSEPFKPLTAGLEQLLARLEPRTQHHLQLAAEVRAALPGAEKDHVVSVTYRDETLIVLTDSAAWCPYIRYAQAAVFERLRQINETRFTKLKVKVVRGATL